jgi:hypothetical protein
MAVRCVKIDHDSLMLLPPDLRDLVSPDHMGTLSTEWLTVFEHEESQKCESLTVAVFADEFQAQFCGPIEGFVEGFVEGTGEDASGFLCDGLVPVEFLVIGRDNLVENAGGQQTQPTLPNERPTDCCEHDARVDRMANPRADAMMNQSGMLAALRKWREVSA